MSNAATNKSAVDDTFTAWSDGDGNAFFRLLADDVRWTVIGTTAISGTFNTRQEFLDQAAGKIRAVLAKPLVPRLISLLADGDLVSVQWEATSETNSGKPYRQTYSWVVRFDGDKIVEGTAYLDTELLTAVLDD